MSETALLFLLAYATGLILALFVRPIYGLYTYIGVFYLHPPSRWWGEMLPDIRWSLLAALVTLVSIFIHRKIYANSGSWFKAPMLGLFAGYVMWMWIQMPWVSSGAHMEGLILFSKYVLLVFLLYTILDSEENFRRVCIAHTIGCAYFGVLVYFAPDGGRLEGVGGPGVNDANTLGMHLTTGLIFASFLFLACKGWTRWLVMLTIPFILNGLIQTETRGALVGLAAGGLVIVYLKPAGIRKRFYALTAIAMVVFVGLANQAFLERMSTLNAAIDEQAEWDKSAASRVEIAKSQFRMFKDYPLGVGHQGTVWLSSSYIDRQWLVGSTGKRASHNTVMSVLVDQGIPGIVLFLLIVLSAVKVLVRLKKMDKRQLPLDYGLYRAMLGGALCSILAAGMFTQYLKAEVQVWCLALLAVLMRLATQVITEKDNSEIIKRTPADTQQPQKALI